MYGIANDSVWISRYLTGSTDTDRLNHKNAPRGAFFILEAGWKNSSACLYSFRKSMRRSARSPNRKSACPRLWQRSNAGALRTRKSSRSAKEALLTAQKNKRDRDKDLEAGVQKVEKLKARTSEIKNNKEYQALLKEIETAEQENKAIEDDILVLMEKIDAAAAADNGGRTARAGRRRRDPGRTETAEAAFAKLEEELKAMEQARQKTIAAHPAAAALASIKSCSPPRRHCHCRGARRVLLRLLHEHSAPGVRERQEEREHHHLPELQPHPVL